MTNREAQAQRLVHRLEIAYLESSRQMSAPHIHAQQQTPYLKYQNKITWLLYLIRVRANRANYSLTFTPLHYAETHRTYRQQQGDHTP